MGSASAADTWRDSVGGGRSPAGQQVPRRDLPRHDATPARAVRMSLPPVPPPPPRGRPGGPVPERRNAPGHGTSMGDGRPVADSRPPAARPQQRTPSPGVHPRSGREAAGPPPRRTGAVDRPPAPDADRTPRTPPRTPPAGDRATGLRGALAVLGVFVLTLAGGAVDSFLGIGLGTLTLVTLVAASAVGALLVRKRDLLTLVVAPPLVFVLVAAVNVVLAPSASFNLPTLATVLIRGFPTMVVATLVALVVAIVRWAARR
jgi:hypothetical protein